MAAVVGPIRIDHANLGYSRVTLFFRLKIALTENDVVKVHCERVFLEKSAQLVLAHRDKAVDSLDGRRNLEIVGERLGQRERSLAALDRVYHIVFDAREVVVAEVSGENIHLRRADGRTLLVGQELYALRAGIGALIELSGQVLDREHAVAVRIFKLVVDDIALRFGEYRVLCLIVYVERDPLDVVAVQHTQRLERCYHQILADIRKELSCLDRVLGLLFDIDS